MTQLFSSDWHCNHKNILKYCKRPFKSVEEMEESFFKSLEKVWKSGDVFYFLGDLTLKPKFYVEEWLDRFPAGTIFLYGNHDERNRKVIARHKNISWAGDIKYIKLLLPGEKKKAMLCHYPMRSWRSSSHSSLCLHGHSHGKMPWQKNQLDVSIDNAFKLLKEYKPFTAEEILVQIENVNGVLDAISQILLKRTF